MSGQVSSRRTLTVIILTEREIQETVNEYPVSFMRLYGHDIWFMLICGDIYRSFYFVAVKMCVAEGGSDTTLTEDEKQKVIPSFSSDCRKQYVVYAGEVGLFSSLTGPPPAQPSSDDGTLSWDLVDQLGSIRSWLCTHGMPPRLIWRFTSPCFSTNPTSTRKEVERSGVYTYTN